MARKPAPASAPEPEARAVDQAFDAAREFLGRLDTLADWARRFDPSAPLYPRGTYGHLFGHNEIDLADRSPRVPSDWDRQAFNFADAFLAWYDLTYLLTPAVRGEALRVHPLGAPGIQLTSGVHPAPRREKWYAKPYPTVIEAVADGLGVYFRNAVYQDRRHPLDLDRVRVSNEAMARATARQVAQGRPAEPFGWGADYRELMEGETRATVLARLGIKTHGNAQDLMMREWKAQDGKRRASILHQLRCEPIVFSDLQMQLLRESEAVKAAASAASTPTLAVIAELLERLQTTPAAGTSNHGAPTPTGPTIDDLCSDPRISTDTFRRVRKAAGIKVKERGSAARNRRYTPKEVDRLIAAALAGSFIKRAEMAAKWARYGSKEAARKPHGSK